MLLEMHEAGAFTWVTHVKSILCDNGFEQVWLFGGDEKMPFFFFFFFNERKIYSPLRHGWRNHLESSDRLLL